MWNRMGSNLRRDRLENNAILKFLQMNNTFLANKNFLGSLRFKLGNGWRIELLVTIARSNCLCL